MTKLCKDCKWVEGSGEYAKCNAPSNIIGSGTRNFDHCTFHRQNAMGPIICRLYQTCGRSGRWWEPKSEEQLRAGRTTQE